MKKKNKIKEIKILPHEKGWAEWESRTPTFTSTKNAKYKTITRFARPMQSGSPGLPLP
jgi:hypothetical protein